VVLVLRTVVVNVSKSELVTTDAVDIVTIATSVIISVTLCHTVVGSVTAV
jgi:hypothetical protein